MTSPHLLQTVRRYYELNKHKPHGGVNWRRVLIAFGDIQDDTLEPFTAAEARQEERKWSGWAPIRRELERLERPVVATQTQDTSGDPPPDAHLAPTAKPPVLDPEPSVDEIAALRADTTWQLRGEALPDEALTTVARFTKGGDSWNEYSARIAYLNSLTDEQWARLRNYPGGGYRRHDRTDSLADPNVGYASLEDFRDMVELWLDDWITVAQQVREEQRKERVRAQIASRKQEQARQAQLRHDAGYKRHNGDPRQGWVHESADVDESTRVASNAVVHGGKIRESDIGSRAEVFGGTILNSRLSQDAKVRDNARLERAFVFRAEVRDNAVVINASISHDPYRMETFVADDAYVEGTKTTEACRDWVNLNGGRFPLVIEGQVSGTARIVGSGRHRDRIGGNARLIGANINTVGNLGGDAELGADTWVSTVTEVRCKVAAPGFKCSTTGIGSADGRSGGPPILRKGWEVRDGKIFDEHGATVDDVPREGGFWWTTSSGEIARWMGGYRTTERKMPGVVVLHPMHPQPDAQKAG